MNTSYHAKPLSDPTPQGSVRIVPHYDVQWSRPVFRPPSLPSPTQIYAELPFTAFRFPRVKHA